jgi:hypothetical protein
MSFVYLATPYSKAPQGLDYAHKEACEAAAAWIKAGVPCYSPIAHTHPIAIVGDIDPLNHDIWLPADRPMMDASSALVVVMFTGWDESYGIKCEIREFEHNNKPIFFWQPGGSIPVDDAIQAIDGGSA